MESIVMSALLRIASLLWTYTKDGESQHVPVDGRLVLMSRSKAQRYWELRSGDSGVSLLVNESINNDRI